jgi:hypothetical protein
MIIFISITLIAIITTIIDFKKSKKEIKEEDYIDEHTDRFII